MLGCKTPNSAEIPVFPSTVCKSGTVLANTSHPQKKRARKKKEGVNKKRVYKSLMVTVVNDGLVYLLSDLSMLVPLLATLGHMVRRAGKPMGVGDELPQSTVGVAMIADSVVPSS